MLFTYLLSNPVNGAHFRLVGSDGTSDSSPSNTVVYSAALPAVTGLTATQGSVAQKVTLSWDSFTGATQYAALRGTSKNGTYVEIGTPTAATIFDDTTAQPGTHYWYKIIASDGSGMISSPSAGAEGWAMDMPPAPANLAASDATFTDHVHLDWDAVSGATNYHVWRSDTQGSGHVEIGTSPTNSYDDATVADTAPKYYYVTAENAAGISVPGNEDAGSIGPSGSGLTLVITNPPAQGDGSSGDPYVVNVGENYGFTLTDSVDGDVTLSPNSLYQTSDPNATASNGNLSIGPGTGDFEFDGTYQSNQSNKVYFKMQAASALVILPHPIDPNWLGVPNFSDPDAGTSSNAYVMHNASFNPDNNNDGTYDDNFMLEAKENGNVVDNETLTWASFPPFVALDVNNTGTKGQFHANQFSVGYIFAQSVTEESNHLYVEVTLTP